MNLREYLAQNHMSVAALAVPIGVSYSYLRNCLANQSGFSLRVAKLIEDYTGGAVTVDEIVPCGKTTCPTCGRRVNARKIKAPI